MLKHRLNLTVMALWLGVVVQSPAQPAKADRDMFDQVRARAEKGNAEAQLELGNLYDNGTGVVRDRVKAAKWHRLAAEQGLARAQYQVGLDYANGEGVKEDKIAAYQWFLKAAKQGFAMAQLVTGQVLIAGEGTKANSVEGIRWFRQAADQGLVDAEYELGKCFFEGTGVAPDIVAGVTLTRRAAERGFAPAQNKLGECYKEGLGVGKDYIQAYKWMALAAAQDDEHANDIRVSLAGIEALLSKEQVAQAQALARDFKPTQNGISPTVGSTVKIPAAADPNTNSETAQTGSVEVNAEDSSCEIFADGAFVGNPPAKLKLAAGPHVVVVKKSGFKDYKREIQVSEGSQLTLRATLDKQ
jgi:TPR repeat protein